MESRRRAAQGLCRRRDHRQAFLRLLPAGGDRAPLAAAGAEAAARGRPARGRGLAPAQGRQPLLGRRDHHRAARRDGRAARLLQGHPRPHRAPRAARSVAPERGALPAARRERQGLRDLHARSRGTRDELERGRRAHQGLQGPRDHRPALRDVLSAGRGRKEVAGAGACHGARARTLRRRGCARAQGRQRRSGRAWRSRRSTTATGFSSATPR